MASLKGKTVCFTGTLTAQRSAAATAAILAGATVSASVTSKTDILVAGPGAGSKMEAAKAKGVEVWNEAKFNKAARIVDKPKSSARSTLAAGNAAKASRARKAPAMTPSAPSTVSSTVTSTTTSACADSLSGKTIVFSGTLQVKRSSATTAAVQAGATVAPSVTATVDILVAGPGAGSKLEAAEKKGVEVWDEARFMAATSSIDAEPPTGRATKKAKG